MTLPPLLFTGIFAGSIFSALELVPATRKESIWKSFDISLMLGLMGTGVFAYLFNPTTEAVVPLISYFAPHAYNLILWPALSLLVLLPRFGPKLLIPSFMFVYGLDELLWNVLAFARFGWLPAVFQPGGGLLFYVTGLYWRLFLLGIIGMAAVGYYIVRPRIRANPSMLVLLLFAVFWAAIGMPTGAVDWESTSFELMWQAVIWLFAAASFWPRGTIWR